MTLHPRLLILIIPLVIVCSFTQVHAERFTLAQLSSLPDDTSLTALVLMRDRPDIDYLRRKVAFLPRDERAEVIWRELDELASRSQQRIRRNLEQRVGTGELERIEYLRLVNGIVLHGSPRVYENIMDHPDISQLIHVIPRTIETNAGSTPASVAIDAFIPWHLEHIQAPQCWAAGYTGAGVLVAIIDTGINYFHTDLADHLWDGGEEYPNHGYDFAGSDDPAVPDNDPIDESGHGAGVAGLIAGDGTSGTRTGVAPDATIMGLRVRQNLNTGVVTDTWLAQDFALEHGVDIISMSLGWGHPGPEDRPIWREVYEVLEAAGIVCVKSAGNRRLERDPPDAISVPGGVPSPWRHPDEVESGTRGGQITVGGVDQQNNNSEVSSPGPVTWEGIEPWDDYPISEGRSGLIKPDICAPSVNGTSLPYDGNSTYAPFNNTSMAQPHVAGVVALMLSKNYNLLPVEVDSILQTTALDLGVTGKDNDFGAGLVQAKDALDAVAKPEPSPGQFSEHASIVDGMTLDVVYPNPFNPWTVVRVFITDPGHLKISVFNALGQQVDTLTNRWYMNNEVHEFPFDASDLASGPYFILAEFNGNSVISRKVTYTK